MSQEQEREFLPRTQGLLYSELYGPNPDQHVITSLLTYSVVILALYNTRFDPFRLLLPKSLFISSIILPYSILVTRIIGQNQYHYKTFDVFALFDTRSIELFLCILVAFVSYRSRFLSPEMTSFKGLFLRVYPIFFSILKIMVMTPIYSDSTSQKRVLLLATYIDTITIVSLMGYAAIYSGLLGWRTLRGSWRVLTGLLSIAVGSRGNIK